MTNEKQTQVQALPYSCRAKNSIQCKRGIYWEIRYRGDYGDHESVLNASVNSYEDILKTLLSHEHPVELHVSRIDTVNNHL